VKDVLPHTDLHSSRLVGIAAALYVLLVILAGFYFNLSLTPDRVAVLLLILALATGRVRAFLKDWSLFLVVILAWQVLQGMSGRLAHVRPHVTEMIDFDRLLFFGQVPTLWLQHHFYHPGHISWYDIAATLMYEMHFILPMAIAFALWLRNRSIYVEFMLSFFAVALAGFTTYVLFPAAPPWIAANWWHYLPHVYKILDKGMYLTRGQISFSTLYQWMWSHGGWDRFGAVPSEHAALPFLCFLYARKCWRRAGWLLLLYSLAVGVAVVYLGEHYVTDVLVGFLYAGLGYVVVQLLRRASQPTARSAT
jgi:membrane-associated phospholipid phosphatase